MFSRLIPNKNMEERGTGGPVGGSDVASTSKIAVFEASSPWDLGSPG